MGQHPGRTVYSVASIILAAALCACSSTVTSVGHAQPLAPITNASLTTGTVVAVRPIDIGEQNGTRSAVNNVLLALQQPSFSAKFISQEVVIRRSDGTAISIIDLDPGLAIGDEVAVITGPTATVVHRD